MRPKDYFIALPTYPINTNLTDTNTALDGKLETYGTYPTTTLNLTPFTSTTGYVTRETLYVTFKVRMTASTYAYFSVDGTEVATVQNNGNGEEIFQVNILMPKGTATKFAYGGSGTAVIDYGRPIFTLRDYS